jgi:hypothetical protein
VVPTGEAENRDGGAVEHPQGSAAVLDAHGPGGTTIAA